MRIAKIDERGRTRERARSRRSLRPWILGGKLLAFALYSVALVLAGLMIFRAFQPPSLAKTGGVGLRQLPQRAIVMARNHWGGLTRAEPLERLHLDIKFKNLQKLQAKRSEAIATGVLMTAPDDLVPAEIRHLDRTVRVRVRLKGDLLDHLHGDKWSLRVEVRGSDQLFGMRRFSLQSPRVRDFQAEPIFLEHLRSEGVLTPRYRFVDLSVNGRDIGVMAVEEHFSKELLEAQRRREGVIVRFDESDFWRNLQLNGTFGAYGSPYVSTLTAFRKGKVAKSEALRADRDAAIGSMRAFLDGRRPARRVFDLVLMARFMAVCEVWRAGHPLAWHNLRFYYNPLTALLEPIGFDGNVQGAHPEPGLVSTKGGLTPLLLADPEFRAVFIRELRRIAGDAAEDAFVTHAAEREKAIVIQLQEGMDWIAPLHLHGLASRAALLATIDEASFGHFLPPLGDPKMRYPVPVRAYLCETCPTPRIELRNILPVPVEIVAIEVTTDRKDTASGSRSKTTEELDSERLPILLPATESMTDPQSVFVDLPPPPAGARIVARVHARVSGQVQRNVVKARPYADPVDASPIPSATVEETVSRHPFLRLDADGRRLVAQPGTWRVADTLIVPEGLGLTLPAGTDLRFEDGVILVSSGPLRFEGSADRPVRLRPAEGSKTWGGLVSLGSTEPHVWSHVIVERTTGIQREGWRLTGGVTIRRGEIEIAHSRFEGHRGEDALNLVRSQFVLEDVAFHDAPSDALDADFSDGVIRGGVYSSIGGDGIDVSGAKITVDGAQLVDIADKALSVGEASQLTARNVRATRVGSGAASKDASELHFFDSTVEGAAVAGVSVYTKKPEYGPARATLERVEMRNVATDALVQEGSVATLDGVEAPVLPFETDILY